METDGRKVMRYSLYKVDPAWRRLPDEERALHKKEFAEAVAAAPIEVYPYSTVGLRADSDLLFWQIAEAPEGIRRSRRPSTAPPWAGPWPPATPTCA